MPPPASSMQAARVALPEAAGSVGEPAWATACCPRHALVPLAQATSAPASQLKTCAGMHSVPALSQLVIAGQVEAVALRQMPMTMLLTLSQVSARVALVLLVQADLEMAESVLQLVAIAPLA